MSENTDITGRFQIRYTRTAYHVYGIESATTGTQMDYPVSACPSLSRNGRRMATGPVFESLRTAVVKAQTLAKNRNASVCKSCEKAAERLLNAS